MHIDIVSSLDSGSIASLLEVFAIFTGLFIAANLQAIVSLAARRRLFSRGTALLSDSTWNVGVLQGLINPRRLLRDFRACLAFMLALVVICLEVLTVMQTRSSKSCAFGDASTWKIQKSMQKCFSTGVLANPEIVAAYSLASSYVDRAKDTAKNIDLKLGIPVETDVFEDSIISGKAVQQLKEGKYAERYTAPAVEVFDITGKVSISSVSGTPFSPITVLSGKDAYTQYSETRCGLFEKVGAGEQNSWYPRDPEFGHLEKNRSLAVTAATGYFDIQPCQDNIVFRICDYIGGRQDLPVEGTAGVPSFADAGNELSSKGQGNGNRSEDTGDGKGSGGAVDGQSFGDTGNGSEGAGNEKVFITDDGESFSVPKSFLRQAIPGQKPADEAVEAAVNSFQIQCKIHVISREGRKTDSNAMFVALFGAETFDTSTIRRAVLVSLIAQNSASKVRCRRYLAAPKKCTQIGWVSIVAVLLLMGLFVLTSLVRIGLKLAARDQANFNGSPQRLAEALFSHFEGPDKKEFDVSRQRKKRELFLGPRLYGEDIRMSVVQGVIEPDSYRIVWTRGPLPEGASPVARIPGKEIILQAENAENDEEVSLI